MTQPVQASFHGIPIQTAEALPSVLSPSIDGSGPALTGQHLPGMASPRPLWARPAMHAVSDGIFRPGGLALTDRLAELAGVLPGWRVLDAGCGTGASVLRLRQRYGAYAVGMDALVAQMRPEPRGPNVSKQYPRLPLAAGRVEHPPFMDGTFRMILCECVLSLLPDTRAALNIFHSLLAPGGVLALSDLYLRRISAAPQPSSEITSANIGAQGSCFGWRADKAAIEEHLRHTGFALRHFEDHSRVLDAFAARLVFAGESPCLLSAAAPCSNAEQGVLAGQTIKPGYFLLLADKCANG